MPEVSVVLTSYNHEAYIAAAIESVLNQTFKDFELLIVDDGSSESSQKIIKTFKDPRIKTFLYKENRGPVLAIADAYKYASGKYIAVHHSDDLWTNDKLEKQVKFLHSHKNYAACFTWVDFIDENGELHQLDENDFYRKLLEQYNRPRAKWLNYFFYNANCLCHPSVMIRRDAYKKFHLLDVHGLWQVPDLLMWIRLCFNAEIFIMPERLTQFRLRRKRQENTSATTFDRLVRADLEFFFVAQEFISNFKEDKFFLEVFPEAKKFVVNGHINRNFALAQLCLSQKNVAPSAFQLTGLELIKNLLNNPADAAQIKELYDYDEKTFLKDSGTFDLFHIANILNILHSEIFVSDGGEYSLAAQKSIPVDGSRKFYGRFDFNFERPIKVLRFDPDNNFISIKLDQVLINGTEQKISSTNANDCVNKFYRFLTLDPQIIFNTEKLSGQVTVEIFGEREENYSAIFEQNVQKIIVDNQQLANTNSNLAEQNQQLTNTNSNLAEQNQQLTNTNSNLAEQNQQLTNTNSNLAEQNQQLTNTNSNLSEQNQQLTNTNSNLSEQNQQLNLQRIGLIEEIHRLNLITDSFSNFIAWKFKHFNDNLPPWSSLSSKDKILTIGRIFYKTLPLSRENKNRFKDKFYTAFSFLLKDTRRYKNWQFSKKPTTLNTNLQLGCKKVLARELSTSPGKIAIQAHIFYLDLLNDMANYCANMPYKFDALISIVDASAEEEVRIAFEKIPNIHKCIVRVFPNRGRDVAPFLVGFGDLLPKYDFIAHIHSKKSLYTGEEQQNWRNYLFDALLGSPTRIRKIFQAFVEDNSVGVIYPQPAPNVPYAAFTWMSNRAIGQTLLQRAGIAPNNTEYFDFPSGTMFWARTKALQKFFALKLTFDDFPLEQKQNDGTLAHAFERTILLAARTEGMNYYEFNPSNEICFINLGNKSMWQYFGRNKEECLDFVISRPGILSFDIFDTLLLRLVACPAHVNEIISLKVADLLGYDIDFPKRRIEAENHARKEKNRDVTLNDIYESFSEVSGLDDNTCKKIQELEISTELSLIVPRKDAVNVFHRALKQGKKIWLISDMYMQTPEIEKILRKCGIKGYDKLIISSETGLRKDTAELWDHLAKKNLNSPNKLMHVGDNETSDVQLPGDRNFGVYHLMSAINLFSQIPFGRILLERLGRNMSLYAGICLGVVLVKKFQSPFQLSNDTTAGTNRLTLKTFRDLGYWLYGTPFLTFMLWFIQKTRDDQIKRILFFSREGYFLQPLYKFVMKMLNSEPLPSDYFLTSRRAVTVASIQNIEQACEQLQLHFKGTMKDFFSIRFGLEIDDDRKISLPDESADIVKNAIFKHSKEILSIATDERKNFEKYIANLGGSFDDVGVVDMGYSGTIQYNLQRLMGKNLKGYYFATNNRNLFGEQAKELMSACFTENDDYNTTASAIYKYQLLFEAILTAPEAQLKCFDAEGKPIFGEPEINQNYLADISEVHKGIKDFCRDVLENFGDIILRVPIDKNFVESWVSSFLRDDFIISPKLRDIFNIDDEYCNTFHGNALNFYRELITNPIGSFYFP